MLSPFECLCGNFILPEPASYVFFYAIFNLRKLFYLILLLGAGTAQEDARYGKPMHNESVVFNENILPRGSALLAYGAMQWLEDRQ